MLKAYYRWKYQRQRRAGSFKMVRPGRDFFGASFGVHMADASVQGGNTSGRFDIHRQRRRRWIKRLLIAAALVIVFFFIRESIRGWSLFSG